MKRLLKFILLILLTAIISSCQKSGEGVFTGIIYYYNSNIPISDVNITIDKKTTITDENGKFKIQGIRAGLHKFTAIKNGFNNFSKTVQIDSETFFYDFEMKSDVYTSTLAGNITSINLLMGNQPPVFCEVVVINPDGSDSRLKSQTSSSGYFELPFVPQGKRTVKVKAYKHDTVEIDVFIGSSDYELNVDLEFNNYIGEYYQGGIIAYILQNNDPGYQHGKINGLIAAPNDLQGATWGCRHTYIGATETAIGSGASNTAKIVSGCSTDGIAARICDELFLNGYDDWYLPSKEELNVLFLNRELIGGFDTSVSNYGYWSSSEANSQNAWVQGFHTGSQNTNIKNISYKVRAIRQF